MAERLEGAFNEGVAETSAPSIEALRRGGWRDKHELERIKKGLARCRLHTNVSPFSLSRTIKDMLYYLPSLPSFDTSTFACSATQTRVTLVSLCKRMFSLKVAKQNSG